MKHLRNLLWIGGVWIIATVLDVLGFVVVPIALRGLGTEATHLPRWARWWETADNDINGDSGWAGPEHTNGHEREYTWRVRWLLRNRIGVFQTEVLGIDLTRVIEYTALGDVKTSNIPGHSGSLYAEARCFARVYPCYYFVRQWGSSARCLRVYMGWKFRRADPLHYWPKLGRAQFVCSMNPLQRFGESA
jgi:hypothetical protein